jgi:polysaccharide export outer membrane protein
VNPTKNHLSSKKSSEKIARFLVVGLVLLSISCLAAASEVPVLAAQSSLASSYSNYKVQKGDLLRFQVLEDHNDGSLLPVSDLGEIDVPHVGRIQAVGKSCIDLASEIEPLLEQKDYKIATVFIQIDPLKGRGASMVSRPASIRSESVSVNPAIPEIPKSEPRMVESFQSGPSSVASLSEHRFQIGDLIRYHVLEDQDEEKILIVNDQGEINVPLLGRIKASGKTATDLIAETKAILERKYYNVAHVQIQLDAQGKVRGKVFVYGQVKSPGVHEILGDAPTISKAVLGAGGLTEMGDGRNVKVVRKNPRTGAEESAVINVSEILEKGDPRNDIVLQSGDYVVVPVLASVSLEKIYIYGQVRSPGPQEPRGSELMLSTAILNAGGFASFADGRRVKVFRKSAKNKEQREMIVDIVDVLKNGEFEKDVALQPGDRVMVPEKFLNF